MKIVLLKAVPKLGEEGDVLMVADGYARNFLIPKGLAVLATKEAIKKAEERKVKRAKEKEERVKKLKEAAEKLKNLVVTIKAKATEEGKLFGSINAKMIAEEINKLSLVSCQLSDEQVDLPEPIKEVGEKNVKIKLGEGIEMLMKVIIEKE